MKSRLLSVALAFVMILSLVSCSDSSASKNSTPSRDSETVVKADVDNSITVYVTKSGEKYHRSSCKYLAKSKIEITLDKAQSKGYTPCSVCNPPD